MLQFKWTYFRNDKVSFFEREGNHTPRLSGTNARNQKSVLSPKGSHRVWNLCESQRGTEGVHSERSQRNHDLCSSVLEDCPRNGQRYILQVMAEQDHWQKESVGSAETAEREHHRRVQWEVRCWWSQWEGEGIHDERHKHEIVSHQKGLFGESA